MPHDDKPFNVLRVGCDPSKVRRIAITCRCSLRWIEFIPGELHDSDMAVTLDCPRCHTEYRLQNKTIQRVKEDTDDRQNTHKQTNVANASDDKRNYDS